MFSLDRSGAVVSGADLGATFCARTPAQVIRRIVSTAKATRNFFMVVLLEVRAFCAFIYLDTATVSPVRIEPPARSWEEAHIIVVPGAFVIPHCAAIMNTITSKSYILFVIAQSGITSFHVRI